MRRVKDEVERAGNGGKERKTHSKAVANEHERRARQPELSTRRRLRSPLGVPAGRTPAAGECLCYSLAFRQNHLISNVRVQPTPNILYSNHYIDRDPREFII